MVTNLKNKVVNGWLKIKLELEIMLIDKIKNNFNFLFSEYKFIPSNIEDENNEWVLVLILGELRLRFIEDRANLFLDIGFVNAPTKWYEAVKVFQLINSMENIQEEVIVQNNIKSNRGLLKKYIKIMVDPTIQEKIVATKLSLSLGSE